MDFSGCLHSCNVWSCKVLCDLQVCKVECLINSCVLYNPLMATNVKSKYFPVARGTRAGFLIVSSEHRSWYCGSILVSVTTCGSTIHALRVGATLFEPRFCFFLQNALELFPFSPPSIQTTGSARARRRYHTGFAGKSAALMPVVRRQALYKGGRGHRCPFKRRESG